MTEPKSYACMTDCGRVAYCHVTIGEDEQPKECPFGDGVCDWIEVGEAENEQ